MTRLTHLYSSRVPKIKVEWGLRSLFSDTQPASNPRRSRADLTVSGCADTCVHSVPRCSGWHVCTCWDCSRWGRARLSARIRAHTPHHRPIIRIISTPSRHPVTATYTLVHTRSDARSRDPVCTRSDVGASPLKVNPTKSDWREKSTLEYPGYWGKDGAHESSGTISLAGRNKGVSPSRKADNKNRAVNDEAGAASPVIGRTVSNLSSRFRYDAPRVSTSKLARVLG